MQLRIVLTEFLHYSTNLKSFLDTNEVWKKFFNKHKIEFKNIRDRLIETSNKLGISVTDYKKLVRALTA